MQCLHGCQHYKRHMFCPPACPDEVHMRDVIGSYGSARICYEMFEFVSEQDMREKFVEMHLQVMEQERLLRSDNRFAMAFISTACNACDAVTCELTHCRRPHIGRMPICATGIDIQHLITVVLGLAKEDAAFFWRGKLAESCFIGANRKALFVAAVLY